MHRTNACRCLVLCADAFCPAERRGLLHPTTCAVTPGGSTVSRVLSPRGPLVEQEFPRPACSPSRDLIPSASSCSCASRHMARPRCRLPAAARPRPTIRRVGRRYAPRDQLPRPKRTCSGSIVGTAWRAKNDNCRLAVQLHDDLPCLRRLIRVRGGPSTINPPAGPSDASCSTGCLVGPSSPSQRNRA